MDTLELKAKFHELIEKVENETLLEALYEVTQEAIQTDKGVWHKLTDDAKGHVLTSYEQSLDEASLLSHSSIQKKYNA